MASLSDGITLVELDGTPTPTWMKGIPPHDPTDASQWGESIEIDAIHYEVSDPAERAELEAAAIEAECDRRDAFDPWTALFIEGSLPAISGGAPEYTAADRADLEAWLDQVDEGYPPPSQISPDELSQLAAHGCI